jgi:Domain of unknown function (DUF6089)
MKKLVLIIFTTVSLLNITYAQPQHGSYDANELIGEFGVTVGAAHYFGDLNTRAGLNRPKPAIGAFYRKQFNNYLGVRLSVHYAQLGYSDIYSKNDFQKRRNLSFNSDIWEFALRGDFNFFKFVPGDVRYPFTPYVTLGLGIFSYNPYAYLNNKKIFLRPLGTEGQNIAYKDANGKTRKPYGSMAMCIPIGFGIKYNVSQRMNFSIEVAQRLTATDYLDDVSTTYVGADKFPTLPPNGDLSNAGLLQDRSYEKGTPIGIEGRQRGWSKQKDQYVIAEIGFTFNISTYKCPSF